MVVEYRIPDEYYFRIHHIRPRFKRAVESVLIFVATEISKISPMNNEEFRIRVNQAIRNYPGNVTKQEKTINNWRTEISSLFGLIEYDSKRNISWSSRMSKELADNQDLVKFFKYFLFYFQYPGGHLKPHQTLEYIRKNVFFKPAKYIMKLLNEGESITGKRFGITKAEVTHCVFNDLRVTRDNRSIRDVVELILTNRENNVEYDWRGDIVRYAGDILDYMVLANLLNFHGSLYYLNLSENSAIEYFMESNVIFKNYNNLYSKRSININDINKTQDDWFHYVNNMFDVEEFNTNIIDYLEIKHPQYNEFLQKTLEELTLTPPGVKVKTKQIGDMGESLIYGHECMKLKLNNREDLIHLVKYLPSQYAVGYDIQSIELNENKRYIEVKSTISNRAIQFNTFHLTTNEWNTAETLDGTYYVYRLMISKNESKLFIIKDPVQKYKQNLIKMVPRDGADIFFSGKSGEWEELLFWQ